MGEAVQNGAMPNAKASQGREGERGRVDVCVDPQSHFTAFHLFSWKVRLFVRCTQCITNYKKPGAFSRSSLVQWRMDSRDKVVCACACTKVEKKWGYKTGEKTGEKKKRISPKTRYDLPFHHPFHQTFFVPPWELLFLFPAFLINGLYPAVRTL